jgi:predicted RND superfamily exporter protein
MELLVFLAFRTGRGVALPFLLMTLSTVWTVGLMAVTGVALTAFSFFMPVMLITASKAYAIFTVNRYYEEAAHSGMTRRDVVIQTMQDMAKPLAMDALAEITGFLSLLAASLWPQQTFGLFIAVGIAFTLVLNFVLLPAVLALLPLPKRQRDYEHGWLPNALVRFGRTIARRRGFVLVASAAVLIVFGVAIPRLVVDTSPGEYLGHGHAAMDAIDALDRNFGGSSQLSIHVMTGRKYGLREPAVLDAIVKLQDFVEAQPEYGGSITSLANVVREMNQKFHADDPSYYAVPTDPKLAAQLLTLFTFSGGELWNMATSDFSQGEVVARTRLHGTAAIIQLEIGRASCRERVS